MDLGLAGRRALVTGGSKGIGLAVASELAAEGASVAICACHPDEVAAAGVTLARQGATVYAVPTDVTDAEQLDAWVQGAAAALGGIDAVYACAPDPRFFATSVIRAACLNLTKVLAQQYGPEGILVNSVNIGFVTTPQWANIKARRAPDLSDEEFFAATVEGEVLLGRFGTVEEVAGLVTFLAGDRASYLTGTSIDVAGGMGRYA